MLQEKIGRILSLSCVVCLTGLKDTTRLQYRKKKEVIRWMA